MSVCVGLCVGVWGCVGDCDSGGVWVWECVGLWVWGCVGVRVCGCGSVRLWEFVCGGVCV